LAEFQQHHAAYRAAGFDVAALSVDETTTSEAIRRREGLAFTLLCDPTADIVVKAWGLFNRAEKGGISRPAIFVIDPGLRIRYQSVDGVASRVRAPDLLTHLQAAGATSPAPRARVVIPRLGEMLRTIVPALKATVAPARRRDG
jgi:peroxiredoxin